MCHLADINCYSINQSIFICIRQSPRNSNGERIVKNYTNTHKHTDYREKESTANNKSIHTQTRQQNTNHYKHSDDTADKTVSLQASSVSLKSHVKLCNTRKTLLLCACLIVKILVGWTTMQLARPIIGLYFHYFKGRIG